ncbi:MAG: two-component sensor histidine kinase [Balneola sp.]|jgi:signal transduction histidine kinase|nr:two-component sensor histidine kinase [Balneola sp.]MBE77887.1 two-component sensor histidine kinase [Balneola sp.]|tara:strand:- start:1220 stop:2629 length:1410 start_codon:yes stop_codon:yes gene_type:complete
MKIRSKLAWTYIILLIIGVITISAYSILTIRSFLLDEGIEQFERDALSVALAAGSFKDNALFDDKIQRQAQLSQYEMAVYDKEGIRFLTFPNDAFEEVESYLSESLLQELEEVDGDPIVRSEENPEKLIAYVDLGQSDNAAQYIRISQDKSQYYAAVASIRHIIYAGMFFSIGAVIVVSILFARYMAAPIQRLNEAALSIAKGDFDKEIDLNRNDEFGTLADSLNHMAGTLRADNEKLKRLNEKQSQFFADITHEVRNPLHTISGALEMLELENLQPEKKTQYMVTAQKQIRRIARLFEDIKTLQRYDFDENFINREIVDLQEIVKEVFTVYQPLAQKKELSLKTKNLESSFVLADSDKMEQVLENLVSNAIKYTLTGKIEIGFTKSDEVVEVYVKDSGPGIGKEHLERLFDRFYRTDKARSRDKGGTGLGLSVVKGILNAHQSDIKVESTEGKGSRFYFTLPLVDENS